MNEPDGRFGSFRPRARAADRRETAEIGLVLADDPLVELVLHAEQLLRLLLGELEDGDAGPGRQDLGDLLLVDLGEDVHLAGLPLALAALALLLSSWRSSSRSDAAFSKSCASIADSFRRRTSAIFSSTSRTSGRRGHPADPHPRARLVDQVDRLVGQEPVGDVAVGEVGRRDERVVGEGHAVVRLVPVAQALQDLDRVRDGRLLDARSAGTAARAPRPSRGACGTRRASSRRSSAARRARASA